MCCAHSWQLNAQIKWEMVIPETRHKLYILIHIGDGPALTPNRYSPKSQPRAEGEIML